MSITYLTRDSLAVGLPQTVLSDVGGQVSQWSILRGEHVVSIALEHRVVHLVNQSEVSFESTYQTLVFTLRMFL